MKRTLALGVLAVLAGLPAWGQDPSRADAEKLQGKWAAVSLEEDGKNTLPKGGITVLFKGDKATYVEPGVPDEVATFKVDAAKSPKHLDLYLPPDPKDKTVKELTILAIYQLDGDTLKICYRLPKDKAKTVSERPAAFDSKNGGYLLQLKRAK